MPYEGRFGMSGESTAAGLRVSSSCFKFRPNSRYDRDSVMELTENRVNF
jgi:hypothetical protein